MTILSLMRVKSIKLHARQKQNLSIYSTKEPHCGFWLTLSQITITVSSVTAWTVTRFRSRCLYPPKQWRKGFRKRQQCRHFSSKVEAITASLPGPPPSSRREVIFHFVMTQRIPPDINDWVWVSVSHLTAAAAAAAYFCCKCLYSTCVREILSFVFSSLQRPWECLFWPMTRFSWHCSLPGP